MKKYFEYQINNNIKEKLLNYYDTIDIGQHSNKQKLKTNLKLKRIKKIIEFDRNDVVLDIGCSRGFLLYRIIKDVKEAWGIDISKKIIDLNKKNNKSKNIYFKNFNGADINLDLKFNKIFLLDVLEHSFHPDKLLKNIYYSLKKNGYLILQVPFTGWLSEILTKKYHEGHLRYYDPKFLKNKLEKQNFLIKKIKVYNSVPYASLFLKIKPLWNLLNILINFIPAKYYPYFGEITIIAKK